MKYAYKSFLLENESPVKVCGDESLYALQNTSNNTVTLQGSNTATTWVSIIDIPAGTTKHIQSAFAFLKANGELHINRSHGSLFNPFLVDKDSNPISPSNRLPVEATNKTLPVIEASATLQSTSDECVISCANYKSGSFVFQTSANASLTLTLNAVVDGVDRTISFCTANSSGSVYGSLSLAANTSGFYVFEIPVGATSIKLKPISVTSGSIAVKLYLGESTVHQVSLRGGVSLTTSTARVGFVARSALWVRESTTPVNANLTITGGARNTFSTSSGIALNTTISYGDRFAASAGADVVGTLVIDASPDSGTTYYPVASVDLARIGADGNFGAYLETPIIEATMRARLINGMFNQTNAYLTTKMLG